MDDLSLLGAVGNSEGNWSEVLSRGAKRKIPSGKENSDNSSKRKSVSFEDPLMSSTPRKIDTSSKKTEEEDSNETTEESLDITVKAAYSKNNTTGENLDMQSDSKDKTIKFLRKLVQTKEEVIKHKEGEKSYLRKRIIDLKKLMNMYLEMIIKENRSNNG